MAKACGESRSYLCLSAAEMSAYRSCFWPATCEYLAICAEEKHVAAAVCFENASCKCREINYLYGVAYGNGCLKKCRGE